MPRQALAQIIADALVALPRFLTAPLYRHWHLRWGATDAGVAAAMPGDDIVPDPSFTAARAITIAAPPEEVWPWIVQIGTGAGRLSSYDLFDNAARPSADRILPQVQATRVGDSTWSWTLTHIDDGRTRLVTRLKERYDWRSPGMALLTLVIEVREMRSRPRRLWAAGIATAAGVVAAGQLFPANRPSPIRARAVR